jgi:hypothetical protein
MAKSAHDPFEQHADQIRAEFAKGRYPAKPGDFDFGEFCKRTSSEEVDAKLIVEETMAAAYARLLSREPKQ